MKFLQTILLTLAVLVKSTSALASSVTTNTTITKTTKMDVSYYIQHNEAALTETVVNNERELQGTPSPTSSPTTFSPTYETSTFGCGTFQSIHSTGTLMPLVGNNRFVDVTFPTPSTFNLFGDTPLSQIRVYADGCIGISTILTGTRTFMNAGPGTPIATGGIVGSREQLPRISVAHEDLNPRATPGVYLLDTPGISFIVSWETRFYNNSVNDVQAQVELFYDTGDFEIRWGMVNAKSNDRIAAGIDHDGRSTPRAIPAVGPKFGANGVTIAGGQAGMPESTCNKFRVIAFPPTASPTRSASPTSSPTSNPTWSPTSAPTDSTSPTSSSSPSYT
jgi:hypothetical protein